MGDKSPFSLGDRVTAPARQEPEKTGNVVQIVQTRAGDVAVLEVDGGWEVITEARYLKSLKPITPVKPPEDAKTNTHWLKDSEGQLWPFYWSMWEDVWMTYNSRMTPQKAGALGFVYVGPVEEPKE